MRIVSLEPFITNLCCALGLREALAGVSAACDPGQGDSAPIIVAAHPGNEGKIPESAAISRMAVDSVALRLSEPDIVLTSLPSQVAPGDANECLQREAQASLDLSDLLGRTVKVRIFNPARLEDVYKAFERLGAELGVAEKGRGMAQRARAQFLDWGDNFYDRIHNKRVTFLSGISPLRLGGFWIPDMIHAASAMSQEPDGGRPDREVTFEEIRAFRPDVIIVAPREMDLISSAKLFMQLEAMEGFDSLPAAKRGEVFFTDGQTHFYRPDLTLLESMGILISCMAGIDSGYITKRDSFYRLRWLELQRHRFV